MKNTHILEISRKYYRQSFNGTNYDQKNRKSVIQNVIGGTENEEIETTTMKEVKEAISKLKPGKTN